MGKSQSPLHRAKASCAGKLRYRAGVAFGVGSGKIIPTDVDGEMTNGRREWHTEHAKDCRMVIRQIWGGDKWNVAVLWTAVRKSNWTNVCGALRDSKIAERKLLDAIFGRKTETEIKAF